MDLIERYRGSLLGLATGDALGTTLEGSPPDHKILTTIVGGGPFRLKAGEWTDDTSMALCLAESLVECQGFDAVDQMRRYIRWRDDGYMSSNGRCFDIGSTIARSLELFERDGDPFLPKHPRDAGNGSLMRLAPIPLYFANDPEAAIAHAATSSLTTHGSTEASDACRYYTGLIIGALEGKPKKELLSKAFSPVPGLWKREGLRRRIKEIALGSFKADRPPSPDPGTGGYVVPSLHIALWAFYHTSNFQSGALAAVNIGRDADTYGAIYGQLAGAFYGESGIKPAWLSTIAKRDLIASLAEKLMPPRGLGDNAGRDEG